jgi:predicted GNAT family acetyltransferase
MTALSELVVARGLAATVEAEIWPPIAGTRVISHAVIVQMMAAEIVPPELAADDDLADYEIVPLDDADAPEMLALATLTQPGPFFARTHTLGEFVGIKQDGKLAAMAGERMKLPGFAELSGVCTHPDHRGKGYGEALSRFVSDRILGRGEIPFLHAFAYNEGAISLYRRLGFTLRAHMQMNVLAPEKPKT